MYAAFSKVGPIHFKSNFGNGFRQNCLNSILKRPFSAQNEFPFYVPTLFQFITLKPVRLKLSYDEFLPYRGYKAKPINSAYFKSS